MCFYIPVLHKGILLKFIQDILIFIQKHYKKQYAENTRETIRRQTIHQFEQAGIVIRNPGNPRRPTNSPNTVYAISDEALKVIKKYKTLFWETAIKKFVKEKGKLIEKYKKLKKEHLMPVALPDGKILRFS